MGRASRLERAALLALAVFTAVAVAGYWNFALNPGRLPDSGLARGIYLRSFPLFARAHIVLAATVLLVPLVRRLGGRWVPAAAFTCVAAFTAEYLGTRFGFPFGGYEYTGLLGPKILGRVPWVIPASWFLMAVPAYRGALAAYPRSRTARVAVAAVVLTAWDLALDPAMSSLAPYWYWEATGPYYGMPWVNLLGWLATGAVIALGFEWLGGGSWVPTLPGGWLAGYYGVVLAMPLGMVVAAGAWLAVAGTALGLLVCAALLLPALSSERPTGATGIAVGTPAVGAS